jgi:hypothetical protein
MLVQHLKLPGCELPRATYERGRERKRDVERDRETDLVVWSYA